MKERPILFSAEMVRAILADRKTQTRRVVHPKLALAADFGAKMGPAARPAKNNSPYGYAGDRIWVREAFALSALDPEQAERDAKKPNHWDAPVYREGHEEGGGWRQYDEGGKATRIAPPWRPSIYMPRWASRITLEIAEVRIERLCRISKGDVIAEGAAVPDGVDPIIAFADLWDSINGKREGCAWRNNPWVWVIGFRRMAGAHGPGRGRCRALARHGHLLTTG